MEYTLADCVSRINQILNYPAISYEDVSAFFDQAIAELNTSLHIAIPYVSQMMLDEKNAVANNKELVLFSTTPPAPNNFPTSATTEDGASNLYYYDANNSCFMLYLPASGTYERRDVLFGVKYDASSPAGQYYKAILVPTVSDYSPVWTLYKQTPNSLKLNKYLTSDWITLFLIPYVCFKFAVRNGDDGALYSDEFTQGFQQLQNAYDIPSRVSLKQVAGVPAYTEVVKNNLANLDITVPTMAITEDMLTPRSVIGIYDGFYDKGGWD